MNYMQYRDMNYFETEFRNKLAALIQAQCKEGDIPLEQEVEQGESFVRFVTDKVIESYKNGFEDGRAEQDQDREQGRN